MVYFFTSMQMVTGHNEIALRGQREIALHVILGGIGFRSDIKEFIPVDIRGDLIRLTVQKNLYGVRIAVAMLRSAGAMGFDDIHAIKYGCTPGMLASFFCVAKKSGSTLREAVPPTIIC